MLSPGFGNPGGKRRLLPEEETLLEILGWTEDDLAYFEAHKAQASDIRPCDPVAFFALLGLGPVFWTIVVNLVVGVALTYAASLLAPKQQNGDPARLESRTSGGQNIIKSDRFAPTAGFDSSQNVVELGSVVPVIFANRETIDGITYGGVRVNTNLLWSQLYSLGGSQLIKALFMVGFGGIAAIDPEQFAIGDNLLGTYDIKTIGNTNGRLSFYFRNGGGRVRSTDLIAGRAAANDVANSENAGAPDVFQIRSVNGEFKPDFCYASKPSTQTVFGLYAPIGNDLAYRVNPVLRSIATAQLSSVGRNGNAVVICNDDAQSKAERSKQDNHFSTRSGIVKINGADTADGNIYNVAVNDTISYYLSALGDNDQQFRWSGVNSNGPDGPDGVAECQDVAQTISGLQRTWDDALIIGERYRIGSAICILEQRNPADSVFISRVDNDPVGGGMDIEAVFRVVVAGTLRAASFAQIDSDVTTNRRHRNGTDGSHIFRIATASGVLDRPAQVIEIGFKSACSIRINNLCNFASAKSYQEADWNSCERYEGDKIARGKVLTVTQVTSNTYTGPEVRYSFFRFRFRVAGSGAAYQRSSQLFGFRSMTGQPSFNYLRIQFPSAQRWEYTITPVSGWEVRTNVAQGDLEILDAKVQSIRTVYSAGCAFEFSGLSIGRSANNFAIKPTQNEKDLGPRDKDGDSYADAWGKLAEQFIFSEIQASTQAAEHEISYVNLIAANKTQPDYPNLSLLGATIRSSAEMRSFQQLSVYVNKGFSSTHLIGSVLKFFLKNAIFGVGSIVSPMQVDDASFDAADAWTYARRYFFDAGIAEQFNIRQQGAQWAEYFLHDLLIRGGKFYMQPIALFDQPHVVGNLYTAGNISEFEYIIVEPDQRTPPRVSVKWREEKQSSDIEGRGLFPVLREVRVKEAGTPNTAPLQVIDLSDFCTSELHAIDVAKMACRKQRLIKSRIRIKTRPDRAAFDPGKLIAVGLENIQFPAGRAGNRNGVILADGSVMEVPDEGALTPLADGTYTALVWDGTGTEINEEQLEVIGGKTTAHADAVYSIGTKTVSSVVYKVQTVQFTEEGDVEVEATEFPLAADNTSLLTAGWDVASNWVIEGQLSGFVGEEVVTPVFQGVTINGSQSVAPGVATVYSSTIAGPAGAYTYAWSATGGAVINAPAAASTPITWATAGAKTITLSVTLNGVTKTTTRSVTVGAVVPPRPVLGTISINSPPANVGFNQQFTLTSTITGGTPSDTVWQWSTSPDDGEVSVNSATGTFKFTDPGPQQIRVKASSVLAGNVSTSAVVTVTVAAPTIGTVSITGPTSIPISTTQTYTATVSGNAQDLVYAWSANPGVPTIYPDGNKAGYAFGSVGAKGIVCTVTSATASDSPKSRTLNINAV